MARCWKRREGRGWRCNERADNAEFRLALFPPSDGGGDPPYLKAEEIYRADGLTVLFTGPRLSSSDLGVYLELVRLADASPQHGEATFSTASMLKAIGRKPDQGEWLHDVFIRLCCGALDISDGMETYGGVLLKGGTHNLETQVYSVSLDIKLARFVTAGVWVEQPTSKADERGLLN